MKRWARKSRVLAFDTGTTNERMLGPAIGGFILEFFGLHGAYFLGASLFTTRYS